MKKINKIISILSIMLISFHGYSQNVYKNYLDGQIYIRIKPESKINLQRESGNMQLFELSFLNSIKVDFKIKKAEAPFYFSKSEKLLRTFRIYFEETGRIEEFIQSLNRVEEIEFAEKIPLDKIDYVPNDLGANITGVGGQWALHKINAAKAWDISKGNSNIIVAVVDDAIQTNHTDLALNMIKGRDVSDNDNNPNPPNNSFYHGTHVAGIVSAQSNNNTGIASIGYDISIMPVKAAYDSLSGNYIDHGYTGIEWAVNNGANVVNCSWGSSGGFSITNQDVITNAYLNGVTVVASAGNNNSSVANFYPANYPNVIAVASSDYNDVKSSFSNYGWWIDVTAPGESIYSTIPANKYGILSGTSMASPLVAGLCGLMLSVNPNQSPTTLQLCLQNTATNINSLNSGYSGQLGGGRINAALALQCAMSKCPQNLNFFSTVPNGDQECYGTITATNTIASSQTVEYDAGTVVLLKPGFKALSGCNFHAVIEGCGGIYKQNVLKQTTDTKSELNSLFSIYPNPFTQTFTISFRNAPLPKTQIQIFNLMGQLVKTVQVNSFKGESNIKIDMSECKPGVYFANVITGSEKFVQKLIKL